VSDSWAKGILKKTLSGFALISAKRQQTQQPVRGHKHIFSLTGQHPFNKKESTDDSSKN